MEFHRVIGNRKYKLLDLAKCEIPHGIDINNMNLQIDEYIKAQPKEAKEVWYGGYLEKRTIYRASSHFDTTNRDTQREYHLGVDLWVPALTPIYSSQQGIVHSVQYNEAELDYGWCLIVNYEELSYVLYGHLSSDLIKDYKVNDSIEAGQIIAYTGDYPENGGWLPHLHLQRIIDIGDHYGDYPGVCTFADLAFYKANCPDPFDLI